MRHRVGRADRRLARRGGGVELLRLPAALFGAAARLRAAAYDRGVLAVLRVDAPVVSVGNLTAGGTGKTPMTLWLARALRARGLRPGLLSRGYRAAAGAPNDEAAMVARLAPDLPCVQEPDRVAGALELVRRGVDAIVLDDGFQHRRLARDLDVVLVDATRPWGLAPPPDGGEPVCALLPRGLLREPPAALARAGVIVVTRADAAPAARVLALRERLARLAPTVPVVVARHVPSRLHALESGGLAPRELGELEGLEVDLVSGVGNPEAFEATVRGLGAAVREHRAFPDHHPFVAGDLAGLGPRPVVTTAKDAVKLAGLDLPEESVVLVLDVDLEIVEGEDVLNALLDGLPEAAARRERRALHEGLHG